uniref:interleukin-18 receptor 1-like n=1 Tax=Gasterosteus aculeatus aculeatus TaxID=481459 RepID=UPI001A9906D4|nr:interleukin-18 receptor 1-like [Gasterosteus aculeatus aculeatus]
MLCCATAHVITMVQVLLLPLFLLLASLTGVCPSSLEEPYVKAGEMVALYCPQDSGSSHSDAKVIWISYTTQERNLTHTSPAEQRKMGLLVHGRSLVILNASRDHQGNYSCSQGNASKQFWFMLIVCTAQSRENNQRTRYPQICCQEEACTLNCPEVNVPAASITDITSKGITWHKEGESSRRHDHFSSVEEKDQGEYTCTRSYLYYGQIYRMTFTLLLTVKPTEKDKSSVITSPPKSDVFYVELGTTVVIDCKADIYSDFDEISWSRDDSGVEKNNSFPVFSNDTRESNASVIKMTASLVFRKVSEKDLSKNYTCKLESVTGSTSSVTITLAQKPRPSYVSLALGTAAVVVVMVLTVVVYVRFRINITLFLRDGLGCHRSTSDGKSYDAFLMCYESYTDRGLNEDDRRCLESGLEERFGYRVCLYHRDVLPGQAAAEAVLDCIDQSRAVVLVPTSSDPGPESGLLSAIHAALVERQARLIFIQTEKTEAQGSGSLPEALHLLGEAGDCVTWKSTSSTAHSSSFWKQLRYYLPAPQEASPIKLLP